MTDTPRSMVAGEAELGRQYLTFELAGQQYGI